MDFHIKIRSDLVELRPLETGDFEALNKITSDSNMWTYFTSDLSDEKVLKRWISDAVVAREKLTEMPFVIVDLMTGKIAGSTRFGNISEIHGRIEIGWTFLGKEYQGKGINNHVKQLLLKFAFNQDFVRVEAKTDVLNSSARNSLIKSGFKEEGVLRSHTVMTNGRRRDTIFYSVLKDEWEPQI